jgi:1-acyl-sn-glycerol-3-phosphate acyltransferase
MTPARPFLDSVMPTAAAAHARQVARTGGFLAITGAMLPAYLARRRLAPPAARARLTDRWVARWSQSLLDLFGIRLILEGADPANTAPGKLVVANHRSTIDVGILLRHFGGHMVSRADLAQWPVVGPAARSVGTIFVDRTDIASGAAALRAMRETLQRGETVIVFPEGTTFADDEVRPFHAGPFVAAHTAKVAVVPVGLAYGHTSGAAFVNETFLSHLGRMARTPSSQVAMVIGDALAFDSSRRARDLTELAHGAVSGLVKRARMLADG